MLVPGALIDGKYRIVRLIGEGGMGTVYEGENTRIERRVAIKVMHPSIARDRALVGRFEREAQAAAKIGSVHVADVLDLGDLQNGERYLVMEYLEGENLHTRLTRKKKLAPTEVAHIAIQLLEGLAKVHEAGIIHRDLKPANVFLAKQGKKGDFVKILDFGICKMLTRGSLSDGASEGHLLGTMPYMSPEQFASKNVDARTDIYAVGVILYRCVTSKVPYRGASIVEHARLLKEGRPPSVQDLAPDVDATFAKIIHRAIDLDRSKRFESARDLQKALVDWMNRVQHIEHLLGDYLGMKVVSEPPPSMREEPVPESKRTSLQITSGPTPTPTLREAPAITEKVTRNPRKNARTMPMQNAPTIPGMRRPTIPEIPKPRGDSKTKRK